MVIIFLIGQESGNTTKKSAGMREKPSKWNAVSANYIALDWLLQRTLSLNEFIIICERRPHRNTISVPSAPFHDRGRGVGGATKRERYNPSRPPYHHFSCCIIFNRKIHAGSLAPLRLRPFSKLYSA